MKPRGLRAWAVVVLCLCFLRGSHVAAQDAVGGGPTFVPFEGEVVDAQTGVPVAAAIVVVTDLNLTTVTDDFGYFTFEEFPAGTRQLRVMRLGYTSLEVTASIADGEVLVIGLEPEPMSLEGIEVKVITPEELEWRAAGTVMGVIGPVEMEEMRVRTTSLQQVLTTRPLPRVRYIEPRGPMGVGCLRLTTSLAGGGCAAMVVDGILLGPESAEWVYRMSPEEIFAVRFLHGSEAGVRYGYAGSNGVLIIETRRGRGN